MMGALAAAEIELVRGTSDTPEPRATRLAIPPPAPAAISELLTQREMEVLGMMAQGLPNAIIADRLVIKPGTVKAHVKHILRKLDAVNRTEAIARYMGYGTDVRDAYY
jgi:DNA-binding NarL/FixJ family response regulator